MFSKISDYFKIKKQDKEELIELLNSTINNISIAEQEYICIFNNKSSYIDIRKINDWKNKFSKTHDTASSYLKGGMIEKKKIPVDINYDEIGNLRIEARQKLSKFKPVSIGQASRISGVSPADISVLLVYIEQYNRSK